MVGTGLVISRLQDGSWSAPVAIGALGLSWGLQIGGAVCDVMIVLMKPEALAPFTAESGTQFKFGPESGVAVGPMGRMAGVSAHSMSMKELDPAYTYTHAKGLFMGVSMEGAALSVREDVNSDFYGAELPVGLALEGGVVVPPAARVLHHALDAVLAQRPKREQG